MCTYNCKLEASVNLQWQEVNVESVPGFILWLLLVVLVLGDDWICSLGANFDDYNAVEFWFKESFKIWSNVFLVANAKSRPKEEVKMLYLLFEATSLGWNEQFSVKFVYDIQQVFGFCYIHRRLGKMKVKWSHQIVWMTLTTLGRWVSHL